MPKPSGVESPHALNFLLNRCAIRDLNRLGAATNWAATQLVRCLPKRNCNGAYLRDQNRVGNCFTIPSESASAMPRIWLKMLSKVGESPRAGALTHYVLGSVPARNFEAAAWLCHQVTAGGD